MSDVYVCIILNFVHVLFSKRGCLQVGVWDVLRLIEENLEDDVYWWGLVSTVVYMSADQIDELEVMYTVTGWYLFDGKLIRKI
jgi:hypothetical protein